MSQKIREIDTLKAISIIGVVIMHMEFRSRFSEQAMMIINHLQVLLGWCVLAFFFCSGFLMKTEDIKLSHSSTYLFKRANRLLIPCIVFSIFYKTLLIVISRFGSFSWKADVPASAYELFEFIFAPAGPQFYFLAFLFWITAFIFMLHLFTKNTEINYIIVLFLYFTFYIYSVPPTTPHGPGLELIPAYMLAFIWGVMIRSGSNALIHYLNIMTLGIIVFLCFWKQTYIYLYVAIPICLFFLFRYLDRLNLIIEVTQLGQKSSAIYVWHAPLLLPIWSIIADRLIRIDLLELPFVVIFTILSCYVISDFVEKNKTLKWLRF